MATIVKPVEQKTKHLDYFLSQCHRRRYPAKSTIIYAGDKSDSLFYIVKGFGIFSSLSNTFIILIYYRLFIIEIIFSQV